MVKPIRAIIPVLLLAFVPAASSQNVSKEMKDKIDGLISSAYQTATGQFPCRVKPGGKARILHWQRVDSCLNGAADRVDWSALSEKLQDLRSAAGNVSKVDFSAAIETSLSDHALTYEKVFQVKDEKALLPLTNSVLRFLPADSLQDLPVFDKTGAVVGSFVGVYTFERTGALASANTYRLTLFQYTDRNGNVQPAADKLLLDSYGVPWKDARTQRGFRLTSEKLPFSR
jgi:hypothetical protein